MSVEVDQWRPCSSCKKPIAFSELYWTCNVSTCNRKRTGLMFCTVSCWDAHVPIMRHRDSWAEEQRSPSREAFAREQRAAGSAAAPSPPSPQKKSSTNSPRESRRTLVRKPAQHAVDKARGRAEEDSEDDVPRETLIVASKLKAYVRARSGMNTSDSVMTSLSEHVRALCDDAIRQARRAERKTIMDRDFPKPRR